MTPNFQFPNQIPKIEMDRIEITNYTSEHFENVKYRISKYNRTSFVLNAEVLIKFDVGVDDLSAFADIRSTHGSEYKRVLSKEIDKPLEFLKENPHYYENMANYCNVPKKMEFPLKAVSYYRVKEFKEQKIVCLVYCRTFTFVRTSFTSPAVLKVF